MTFQDFFVTPIFMLLLGLLAYLFRGMVTNKATRAYYFPALFARFGGAIALGMIYQFYYGGGDTFNYFTHGSKWIHAAFMDNPALGMKLLFTKGGIHFPETFDYSSHIWYYRDKHSYFIVRFAAFFDLITFHTYTATALFFAFFSFTGLWMFYRSVCQLYPGREKILAWAILFVPTTVFWGSGILKDTVTIGALGWMTYAIMSIVEFRKLHPKYFLVLIGAAWLIFNIKIYILVCFAPMIFVWLYLKNQQLIKSSVVKWMVAPFMLVIFAVGGYFAMNQISAGSSKYSLDAIAQQAAITAYDIRYGWGARNGGDGGYDLGELDGTWQSMIKLMPQAINVSLFRPYLWEVRNPLMLLSALESFLVLILTIRMVMKGRMKILFGQPFLVFCFTFALLFAFAVGVSTFNFGTLMRYKIPLVPFYMIGLLVVASLDRKKKIMSTKRIIEYS